MLKFFKNLFGSSPAEASHDNGGDNDYVAQYATANQHVGSADAGAMNSAYSGRTAPAAPGLPTMVTGSSIHVPLHSIIAILPLELKTRITQTMVAGMGVTLPLGKVLAQLTSGAVRISFGELRAAVPDVFTPATDRDNLLIPMPLSEILPQINPALLPRRRSQRHVQIPEEVRGPFGADCFGVTFADTKTITGTEITASTPPAAPAAPVAPPSPRFEEAEPEQFQQFQRAQPIQPIQPVKPIQPIRPIQPIKPVQPVQPAAQPIRPVQPIQPTAQPIRPIQPIQPAQPIKPVAPIQPVQPFRPVPAAPASTATPAPANLNNTFKPPVHQRGNFASTPTPPPPTATPAASPPVRPVFPTARDVGATPFQVPSPAPLMPAPSTNGNGNGNGHAQVPALGPEAFLNAPMAILSENWPDAVRGEIAQLNLSGVQIALPIKVVEPALKQGRIVFTWKVLRSWIRPAILPTVSALDGEMLELPLRVIAPLFVARQKLKGPDRQKLDVDENIPNLFFGFPQGDSAAPIAEAPAPAAPAPAAVTPPAAAVKPASPGGTTLFTNKPPKPAAVVPDTNFYVWGDSADTPKLDETEFKKKSPSGTDFLTRYATPNEVVSRAAALDGVAGALVALPDGLMVANKLSADLNGDTLAAFLPHIFGKVSQCTKELRMGELNNLHFTVGNVPWKIFRVNAIYFAAFGRAGQPLPTAQLAGLAAELDRKKQ